MSNYRKLSLLIVIVLVLSIFGISISARLNNSPRKNTPIIYSNKFMLSELWEDYKRTNIEQGTHRTFDKQADYITTSEGQSYTMLRSVWMDDKTTFDNSWQWSKDNLQRSDYLLSWKFGRLPDDSYGIQIDKGGENTATDADTDTALSLLMAYSRWQQDSYLYDALPMLTSIWANEVVTINGKPVLVSNNLEKLRSDAVLINPSYLSPYAYKIFAKYDTKHDWLALSDNSYDILFAVSDGTLGSPTTSSGLPPDWVMMDRTDGQIKATQYPDLTTNFSYDAIRTIWRLGLDYRWNNDDRALQVLKKYELLSKNWSNNSTLNVSYAHGGEVTNNDEAPAIYGAVLPYFVLLHPETAEQIFKQKLATLYNPDTQRWTRPVSYYDDNWVWFGIAFYSDSLPNLTEIKQS